MCKVVLQGGRIKTNQISPIALAFIGDSVHTLFVRASIVGKKELKIVHYNAYSSKLCSGVFQSKVFENIKDILTNEELEIARRARNAKTKNIAKGASVEEYKKATAFEAIIGYLYLEKQTERLNHLLELSLNLENEIQ